MNASEVVTELNKLFDNWFSSKLSKKEYEEGYTEVLEEFAVDFLNFYEGYIGIQDTLDIKYKKAVCKEFICQK